MKRSTAGLTVRAVSTPHQGLSGRVGGRLLGPVDLELPFSFLCTGLSLAKPIALPALGEDIVLRRLGCGRKDGHRVRGRGRRVHRTVLLARPRLSFQSVYFVRQFLNANGPDDLVG